MLPRLPLLCLGFLPLLAAFATEPAMTLSPASDAAFLFEGRFDRRNPVEPGFIWAGDRISADFTGAQLALRFGQAEGQTYFDVTVDGVTQVVSGSAGRWIWPSPLAGERHRLKIVKRSEADAGHVVFLGLELAEGAKLLPPVPPGYRLKAQFIGDSITVGANNEDGVEDQLEDRRTHNHVLSYDYLTSQALGADHRAVAVSGMGICEGFVPMIAADTWDKVYPRAVPLKADLAGWVPDLVFVNLGENDDAFTRSQGRPLPAGYTDGYVRLIRAVRAAWPKAQIVLLRGGMYGGSQSMALREAWEKAVVEIERTDPHVAHFVFTHWTKTHPRVSDHRIMSGELLAWLKAQGIATPQ